MAAPTSVSNAPGGSAYCRFSAPTFDDLAALLMSRSPDQEWASFLRFGWREVGDGLVLTLQALDSPGDGDLDHRVGHVAIQEQYTLRIALAAEKHPFAVGVIHSHPLDCAPLPSPIDDEMDGYYAPYFEGFTKSRPYVSLILSQLDGELVMSGRVYWNGRWLSVERFACDGVPIARYSRSMSPPAIPVRLGRLEGSFGIDAARRLRGARVAVIGAGGTGSIAIEVLARAAVGELIIVDPDRVTETNLERLHGGLATDAEHGLKKVEVARRHIRSIDPEIKVTTCFGALPQRDVVDVVVTADIVIGCTDQQHSRLALSELGYRYLVPCIDCGVALEGEDGTITGQTIQLVSFGPDRACALCRKMVTSNRIAMELMSEEERQARIVAAQRAAEQGLDPRGYWTGLPQLNTVGYLTAMAGAMAAGCAIGVIAGRFSAPLDRAQYNLFLAEPEALGWQESPRTDCACQRLKGYGGLAAAEVLITSPAHWPAPIIKHE